MTRVVILDDYQRVALSMADFGQLEDRCTFDVIDHQISDKGALADRLRGAEIVVGMRERTAFDADMLSRLRDLKLLITTGMVNASFDMAAARDRGIVVCGTPGGGTAAAELAFGLILALARQIPEAATTIGDSSAPWQTTLGVNLAGKTLGLLGFGRLGSEVARYANAFRMNVIVWSRSLDDDQARAHQVVRADSLPHLLTASDFVSIHLPQTPDTLGLIGAGEIAMMKRNAFLVNTARGPIVDEAALVAALQEGRIRGAGLDVFSQEPLPADHPFRTLGNVIATPHLGYVTEDTYRTYFQGVAEAIEGWISGTPVRVLNA